MSSQKAKYEYQMSQQVDLRGLFDDLDVSQRNSRTSCTSLGKRPSDLANAENRSSKGTGVGRNHRDETPTKKEDAESDEMLDDVAANDEAAWGEKAATDKPVRIP
jgi:hypothetical protein